LGGFGPPPGAPLPGAPETGPPAPPEPPPPPGPPLPPPPLGPPLPPEPPPPPPEPPLPEPPGGGVVAPRVTVRSQLTVSRAVGNAAGSGSPMTVSWWSESCWEPVKGTWQHSPALTRTGG